MLDQNISVLSKEHVASGNIVFHIVKALQMNFHSLLWTISEWTPFWIWIPTVRKALGNHAKYDTTQLKINIIEAQDNGWKVEHIMPIELRNVKARKTLFYRLLQA